MQLTATNTANYKFDIDHIHDFNFLLGQEGVNYRSESFQVVTRGQNNDFLTTLSNGTYASSWANSYSSYAYLSFFGRGEYNYMDKYYADFSLRTDASSRFGKNGRWAGFWSVGLMWNVLKEKFMRPIHGLPMPRLHSAPVHRATPLFPTTTIWLWWAVDIYIMESRVSLHRVKEILISAGSSYGAVIWPCIWDSFTASMWILSSTTNSLPIC